MASPPTPARRWRAGVSLGGPSSAVRSAGRPAAGPGQVHGRQEPAVRHLWKAFGLSADADYFLVIAKLRAARAVFACNQYIDAQAPWALRKTDPERMEAVLATLYAAIRDLAIVIQPVIPASAAKLLDRMGVPEGERDFAALEDSGSYGRLAQSGFRLAMPSPIFPRLEPAGEG